MLRPNCLFFKSSENKKIASTRDVSKYYLTQRGDRTETWSECRTGSENVNNRLASNKCDNSQSFLIKIFFERFWKVGLKANIVRLIHNYKWKFFFQYQNLKGLANIWAGGIPNTRGRYCSPKWRDIYVLSYKKPIWEIPYFSTLSNLHHHDSRMPCTKRNEHNVHSTL